MNYTHILQMKELKICLKTILFNQIQFFLVEASGTFLSGLAILRVFTFSLCAARHRKSLASSLRVFLSDIPFKWFPPTT